MLVGLLAMCAVIGLVVIVALVDFLYNDTDDEDTGRFWGGV